MITRYLKRGLFILIMSIPLFAHADIGVDATVNINPRNPAPYDQVALTLSSYSFDVNLANITWSAGGKKLLSGVGQKTLSVTLGDVGQVVPITYRAVASDGSIVEGSITLSPQSVDLLFDAAESYVPPFYEGLALPSVGANVQVIASPTISDFNKRVPESNLSFNWYVNDDYKEGSSGLGKSRITVPMDYLSDTTKVRVVVRSPQGNTAEKSLSIYPHDVMPLLYAHDDLLGTSLVKTFIRRLELTEGITLALEPYYLSVKGMESTATYDWYVDGLPVTPEEKKLLSLKPKENSYGSRSLSVVVAQTRRKLQDAKAALEVVFDTRQ